MSPICASGPRPYGYVSVARIQAGDVCNPVVDVTPAPATPWGEAQHEYTGDIYNVSSDGRYAFVNFEGVGFGKFDLTTTAVCFQRAAHPVGHPLMMTTSEPRNSIKTSTRWSADRAHVLGASRRGTMVRHYVARIPV